MWIVGQCLLSQQLTRSGMTQQQLSYKTGISHQQISDYCNNRRMMSLKNAFRIARSIPNCRVEDLYVIVWVEE